VVELATLRARVLGKPVVVMGSAPMETRPLFTPGSVVIAVNGGISSTDYADVWVLNARNRQLHSWGEDRVAWNRTMLQQGRHRSLGSLLLLTRGDEGAVDYTLGVLRKQETTWRDTAEIVISTREKVERLTDARTKDMAKHAISAGVWAVCAAFAAGAASVRMEGFSWEPGYNYAVHAEPSMRGHLHGDRVALTRLRQRYGSALSCDLSVPRSQDETTMPSKIITNTAKPAPEKPEPTVTNVIATKPLFYGNKRIRVGERFVLRTARHFKPGSMAPADKLSPAQAVANAAPKPLPHIKPHQGMGAGLREAMGLRLKPNGVDPLDGTEGPQGMAAGLTLDPSSGHPIAGDATGATGEPTGNLDPLGADEG
jgi:hypothetical protein